jgi:hypothetical protein
VEQSRSLEANSLSAGQGIPSFTELRIYALQSSQEAATDPILSQIKPVRTFPTYLFIAHFNIIIPFALRSFKLYFLLKFQRLWKQNFLVIYCYLSTKFYDVTYMKTVV